MIYKLHPISYLSMLIDVIKNNAIYIIVLFIIQGWNFKLDTIWDWIFPGVVIALFIIQFINHTLLVWSTRYWIEDGQFIVTKGVLNKTREELDIHRIQTMDTTQNIIHQIVGGVILKIKTPSKGIELDTITKQQSEAMIRILEQEKQVVNTHQSHVENLDDMSSETAHAAVEQPSTERIYHLTFKEMLYMAMTSGAIGVTLLTLIPIFSGTASVLPWWNWTQQAFQYAHTLTYTVIMISAVILLLSYIIGVVLTIVRFYGFKVMQNQGQLMIDYGLFSKKHITVPIHRIQTIAESRSFLRHMFGYTSFKFVITSEFSEEIDEVESSFMVLPFIKRDKGYDILRQLMPHTHFAQPNKQMPMSGFRRRFQILVAILLITGAVLSWWVSILFMVPAVVLSAIVIWHSWLSVKHSGYRIVDDEIVIQRLKWFGIYRTFTKQDRVLSVRLNSHVWMTRKGLVHGHIFVASGMANEKIGLRFMRHDDAQEILKWYLKEGETDARI